MGEYKNPAMTFMQRFKLNQAAQRGRTAMQSGTNQSYVPKELRDEEKELRKQLKKKKL